MLNTKTELSSLKNGSARASNTTPTLTTGYLELEGSVMATDQSMRVRSAQQAGGAK